MRIRDGILITTLDINKYLKKNLNREVSLGEVRDFLDYLEADLDNYLKSLIELWNEDNTLGEKELVS